jgi:predicted N-acetyltransferase YhbS
MILQIDYLDEHLDAIPQLARWHHAEWLSVTPDLSVADRIAGFRARARRGSIPTGFVALVDGTVAGMACLVPWDIYSHRHLTPWLATVLVGPVYRGNGIGSALSNRAVEEARALGVQNLYLFTFNKQSFYSRLGWSAVEEASYNDFSGTVMVRRLAA